MTITIPECIEFLFDFLVKALRTDVLWPFVGIVIAGYVVKLVASLLHVNGRS